MVVVVVVIVVAYLVLLAGLPVAAAAWLLRLEPGGAKRGKAGRSSRAERQEERGAWMSHGRGRGHGHWAEEALVIGIRKKRA